MWVLCIFAANESLFIGVNPWYSRPNICTERMPSDLKFPENFLWGTATSPTQVEGHVLNEWTDYVASDGGHCRVACNHYHRYEEDVELMAGLGVNAYRMGIEWSRLQSAPFAPLNQSELERYIHLLDCLRAANITPMVVLHHFSNPPWITNGGGWLNPATVPAFADYAARLVSALKERVYLWNTFNEPDTYASLTYLLGGFPPFHKWRFASYYKVIRHMAQAHLRAADAIRRAGNGGQTPEIGIAKNWTYFAAFQSFAFWDHVLAEISHHAFNRFVLNEFLGGNRRAASTYLGVNYYGRARLNHFQALVPTNNVPQAKLKQLGVICDDMFERHPTGFGRLLRKLHRRFRLPIYITEHGAASDNEDFRIRDLTEHLAELNGAIRGGVDVRGFFYWSLLDNFEWQFGYTKKFGLLSVDFADQNLPRKMTRVGEFYRSICQTRHHQPPAA
ncbi:MAG TPA: family 1 glycosylhydrolase [Verrucomicrobiae bacterium]|nr:family 1 glycosylhydrolase [Verrucomicrobiae bacterium]